MKKFLKACKNLLDFDESLYFILFYGNNRNGF